MEYVGQGTRALGRGGAFAARADDPMALTYNPAALAQLEGTQLMLNVSNAFYDACVTREGTYGDQVVPDGTTDRFGDFAEYRNSPFPRICQNNMLNPGIWLAATHQITDRLGVGFGVMTPASAGHLVWGDGRGGTEAGTEPSPVRYQLVEQDIKLLLPTFGVGARPVDWLRIGFSFQWGVALINYLNYTVLNGTENPSEDVRSELSASDLFIPAAILSLHLVPFDSLDIVLHGRISDDIRAKGDVEVVVGDFLTTPLATSENRDSSIQAAQPSQFGLSLRYNDTRGTGEGDGLANERWDVEVDFVYIKASQFEAIRLDIPSLPLVLEDGIQVDLPHKWKDQISVRIGGDYNVIPDVLAVRAGAHWESTALRGSYMNIDFQPAQRLGLHTGLTLRLGKVDLSLAYAHIFQETVEVPLNSANFRQIADTNPLVVNAGTYETSIDVISLGATYRFGEKP